MSSILVLQRDDPPDPHGLDWNTWLHGSIWKQQEKWPFRWFQDHPPQLLCTTSELDAYRQRQEKRDEKKQTFKGKKTGSSDSQQRIGA